MNNIRLILNCITITLEANLREGYAKETVRCPRFDRILISAASNEIPEPLIKQLKNNGIIVAPFGSKTGQSLIEFKKTAKGELKIKKEISGFIFVPLVEN